MKLSFLLFALSLFLGQELSQSKKDLKSPSLRKAIVVGDVEKHQEHYQDLTASIKASIEAESVHSLIEPSDKPISTSFPNHKNALQRVTNYNQEQPIDIDPNTILHNSLITTNYILPKFKKINDSTKPISNSHSTIL
jgi:hypothetical protein